MRSFFFLLLVVGLLGGNAALAAENIPADRRDYTAGTGHSTGGFSGTFVDPESGDEVNTVIAPRKQEQQSQWPPIYVYPQVAPSWPPQPGPVLSPRGSGYEGQWQSPFQRSRGQ